MTTTLNMKTKIKSLFTAALLVTCAAVSAQSANEHKINMSSGILNLTELMDVEVEGYDGNEVILATSGSYKIPERAKGLRPLNSMGIEDNTGIGLSTKKEGDMLTVYQVSRNSDSQYRIKVPKGVMVKYENSSIHGEDFIASNLSNEIEVKTHGGSITLRNVTGPIVASSVHGGIDVIYSNVNQQLPSSIASVHGDVDVSIPTGTKADMRISTQWGEVYSDLDIQVEAKDGMKVYGAKKINGKLAGGGVDIAVSSTHGNVYLRKK